MKYDKYEFIHDLMKLLNVSEPTGELRRQLEDIFDKINDQAESDKEDDYKFQIADLNEEIAALQDEIDSYKYC